MKLIKNIVYVCLGLCTYVVYAAHTGQPSAPAGRTIQAQRVTIVVSREYNPDTPVAQQTPTQPQRNKLLTTDFVKYIYPTFAASAFACVGAAGLYVNTQNISDEQKAACLGLVVIAEVLHIGFNTLYYYFRVNR